MAANTRDDIYEWLGRKYWGQDAAGHSSFKFNQSKRSKEASKVYKTWSKEDYISFAKSSGKIIPIPEEYWEQLEDLPPLEELHGTKASMHTLPYWEQIAPKVFEAHKKKSDILLLSSCSCKKPYYSNTNNYYHQMLRDKQGYCDFMICSVFIWPIELTGWLAPRVYDLLENSDTIKGYNELSAECKFRWIVEFIKHYNYKKLIMWTTQDAMYKLLNDKLDKWCRENGVEFCILMTEADFEITKQRFGGRAHQSFWSDFYLRNKLDKELGVEHPVPVKPLEDILKGRELKRLRREEKKALMKSGFNFVQKS